MFFFLKLFTIRVHTCIVHRKLSKYFFQTFFSLKRSKIRVRKKIWYNLHITKTIDYYLNN